jgi:hypothetical protein
MVKYGSNMACLLPLYKALCAIYVPNDWKMEKNFIRGHTDQELVQCMRLHILLK